MAGAAAALLAAGMAMAPASPAAGAATDNADALQARVRAELGVFTGWLQANGAQGYIGEVGWPNNADTAAWNALATKWYADASAAGLWTTAWSAGEWWGCGYKLSVYVWSTCSTMDGSLSVARSQASVIEAQAGADRRGLNMSGGDFGTPGPLDATSAFSNANPGTYNSAYHFDTQQSFSYVASRGINLVRLPVRWERVQPTLGGALNAAEVQRISDAVARASAAGMRVIIDIHNYGAYWLSNGTQGVRHPIGSAEVTVTHFASLWRNLSTAFKANAGVAGYGLMNEPVGMAGPVAWEQASQAAVTAIRQNADPKLVLVPGYNWSGAQQWTSQHPRAWITDANVRYEAHHYWDRDNSGAYLNTYAAEVANAQARGYVGSPPTPTRPVIAGSGWYSDGTRTASGPAGAVVQVYAVNAVQLVPYTLILGTAGCVDVVAVLNDATMYAGPSGLIGKVRGTIPLGTAPGSYAVCFRNLTGPRTATGGLTFTVT
ncbi:MAG TPA: cellulase family glycosylhydrolase [Acidimicrobiales bacterium]